MTGRFDLIVSNPPYIAAGDIAGLAPEVRLHDPGLALDGGADGLEAYRRIAADASPLLMKSGRISVEIGAGQDGEVTTIFAEKGFALVNIRKDLAGCIRVLTFQPG